MDLLKRLYEKLHLSVNESKSAVTSAFGRKFLGYELWMARGEVKRAASYKAQKQFKQRIRWCANYRMARVVKPKTGRIYACNRADDRCKSKALLTTCGESPYMLLAAVIIRSASKGEEFSQFSPAL